MKIISKFRDYYDSISNQYLDKEILYLRKNQINQIPRLESKSIPRVSYSDILIGDLTFTLHEELICFCGATIPVITIRKVDAVHSLIRSFYDLDSLDSYLISIGFAAHSNRNNRPGYSYSYVIKVSKAFFIKSEKFENLDQYYRKFNTPCFVVRSNFSRKFSVEIELNPFLKDYDFVKIRDPFTAHQELYMFISSRLQQPIRPMVEISDKDKIHKHGFDKFSFRKLPTKKNK